MAKNINDITNLPDAESLLAPPIDFADLEGHIITVHDVEFRKTAFEDFTKDEYMVLSVSIDDGEEVYSSSTASNHIERIIRSALKHNMLPIRFLLTRKKNAYIAAPVVS